MNKDTQFFKTTIACVPMYSDPNHRSEMTNQLIFNEIGHVLEEKDEWAKVKSQIDKYVGWVLKEQLQIIDHKDFMKIQSFTAVKRTHDFLTPFGAFIEGDTPPVKNPNKLIDKAFSFLNAPYLWGGKTVFGIDCSGFVQIVYRIAGYSLPRDAYQQEEFGEIITFGDHKKGDLAYFENEEGKVTHVGILISEDRILHASGKVKIDAFSEEGIWSDNLQKQTHKLKSIKRIMH
ncbi:MAG: C40 family peptidase [Flavobacteriales bacterium]|jgi:hypothetical protein|nr:C40 family peptidase [Flavobacteriales bacterium]